MRRAFTLLALSCALLLSQKSNAKIWRVNNTPGVAADFTTLQSAHDGANAGDTLHLEGSTTSYGNLTATKKIIILGPGYYLDENPNTQSFIQSAKVGSVNLQSGAAGSVIMGVDFQGATCSVRANDVVIARNKFASTSGGNSTTLDYYAGSVSLYYTGTNSTTPVNNIIITQNYNVSVDINYASTGVLITNNYMGTNSTSDQTTSYCINSSQNAVITVQNNVIRRGKVTAYNSNFTNNIMLAGTLDGTGNQFFNNLASASQFGTGNGNQANITMSNVFVGLGTGITTEGQWKLKAGSPAIGAGYGSTPQKPVDAGIFSGPSPYILAGQPSMPAIYLFETQAIGSSADPIDVKIKVKSAGN